MVNECHFSRSNFWKNKSHFDKLSQSTSSVRNCEQGEWVSLHQSKIISLGQMFMLDLFCQNKIEIKKLNFKICRDFDYL